MKFREKFAIFLRKDLFFAEHLRVVPWSLALASSILVIGLERVCPRKVGPWPRALCPRLHFCLLILLLVFD